MSAHSVAGFVFVALAAAQAMLAGLIAYGEGTEEKGTWHRFFSRWGYTLLLLMVALYEFTEAGWLKLMKPFLFTGTGIIAAATLAAAIVRGRDLHRSKR